MADNLNALAPTTPSSASEADPDYIHPTSPNSSLRSQMRARPRLPAGPRTRKTTALAPSKDDHTTPLQLPPAWTPTHHGSDVQLTSPFSTTPASSLPSPQPVYLPPPPLPPPPPPPQPDTLSSPHNHQHLDDHNVTTSESRPETPTRFAALSPSPIGSASRKPSQATVNSTTAPPLNLPAAQLNLTPEPLSYKYLNLDAAHWTLTSTELQSLVSSAIRESAKEQFIRLLPLSDVDVRIPEDLARIERSWDAAAARWRFEAHRRNMLLRALAASGADSDLLAQLSSTLGTLDSHAQDLLHAAAHRTQIAAASDTHRSSALAVALRKLNASYARRTRDLDKARANINTLRSEVEEAWKVAQEQAVAVDRAKSEATSVAQQLKDVTEKSASTVAEPTSESDNAFEDDDASDSVLPDGASIDLTTISRAQVVDVTGKAVAAQARLTTMPSNPSSSSLAWSPGGAGGNSNDNTPRIAAPPPSAFAAPRDPPSPATPASDAPLSSSASQMSRVSAARRRSTRKSKASLRLPSATRAVLHSRSRSVMRGEANGARKAARSKSRSSRKGKERERDAARLLWLPADIGGSFLEMEGRPAGEEDAYVDGEVDIDEIEDGEEICEESVPPDAEPEPQTAATALLSPPPSASDSASSPPARAPTVSPSPSPSGIAASISTPEQQDSAPRSSGSTPSSPVVPFISRTPAFSPSSRPHSHVQFHTAATPVEIILDPASAFANAAATSPSTTIDTTSGTVTTTTTAASALDIERRGHSLDLPSTTASPGRRHAAGAKIRRSLSELLNFGSSGSRGHRRSMPFPFKGRSNARAAPAPIPDIDNMSGSGSGSAVGSSTLRYGLHLNDAGAEGSEDGWEDTRDDEGSTSQLPWLEKH